MITLQETYEETQYDFTVAGIYDYMGAIAIFMAQEYLNEVFDLGDDYFCGYLAQTPITDIDEEYIGSVIEKLGRRKGELLEMTPVGSRMKAEFLVPSRGLFGYRNEFLTDTKG